MPVVRFVAMDGARLAQADAACGTALLDLARALEVPLHWRCGQGTCGTCKVHIVRNGPPRLIQLGNKERNVMLRAGLLSKDEWARGSVMESTRPWRLACHVMLDEDDWTVIVPPAGA